MLTMTLMTRTLKHPLAVWLLPAVTFIAVNAVLLGLDVDRLLAAKLYAYQGYEWRYQGSWLLQDVIHQGGRALVLTLYLVLIGLLCSSFVVTRLKKYQRGLFYLLASVSLSLIIVSVLKQLTAVPCPWSYSQFGGELAYQSWLEAMLSAQGGRCFPSGHASGAYAWLAVYFFCRCYLPRWRRASFIVVMLLGLIFGVAQQLRGAHFLSHDIWTLTICWYCALLMFYVFKLNPPRQGCSAKAASLSPLLATQS
ncbi:phosphatase PAP2 family protein [Dasania marina]|uniref:phosphatase PAP2 family protein n=1 Tax=Dasania marina TaxID=471499 RepID=UPI0030DA947F|tara:strand:+ start:8555 stop:9310 length:756 start_codon:yes stop_codon:yes gene_type:complete